MNENYAIFESNENVPPEGWAESVLFDIVSYRKGKKPNSLISDHKDGFIPYILIDQMKGKPANQFTDDKNIPIATEADVLIVWDGSVGKTASGINGALGSTIAALKPFLIESSYLEYFLRLCVVNQHNGTLFKPNTLA